MTEKKTVRLRIDGRFVEVEEGTKYTEIVTHYSDVQDDPVLLVRENNRLRELHHVVQRDCEVKFLTISDPDGFQTYVRSLTMLMLAAADEVDRETILNNTTDESVNLRPENGGIIVHFAVSKGLYCTRRDGSCVSSQWLSAVKDKMRHLVEAKERMIKTNMPTDEAAELFAQRGMTDKQELMRFRIGSRINIYRLGDFIDYNYGYMAYDTSCLTRFDLTVYEEGFVLRYPQRDAPGIIPPFVPDRKLFQVQHEALDWGAKMQTRTVAELNGYLLRGEGQSLILRNEAWQERQIAKIAEQIAANSSLKFVMIAGPSSSGKTTFSHRLSAQLGALGLIPHPVEVDSYFKNREDTPINPDGSYNFECLEAMDTELFNRDMSALLAGERIDMPTFNFRTGRREYKGNTLQLKQGDILVIEGIHGLNDAMSYALPRENKFKIYISSLTQLNLDEHNRIATTDARLIRRIVRDERIRGTNAEATIAMWPSVRAGEESYIFPYQESADVMFNSALIYELCVLKTYVQPLLLGIDSTSSCYKDARKLLKFLEYIVAMPSDQVPANSLIREFIGGGCFHV